MAIIKTINCNPLLKTQAPYLGMSYSLWFSLKEANTHSLPWMYLASFPQVLVWDPSLMLKVYIKILTLLHTSKSWNSFLVWSELRTLNSSDWQGVELNLYILTSGNGTYGKQERVQRPPYAHTEAQGALFAQCVLAETVWGSFMFSRMRALAMPSGKVKASLVATLCWRPVPGRLWSGFEGRVAAVGFVFTDPVMERLHS